MSEKGFKKLQETVTEEYEKKGYSKKEAEYIGTATAGEVANEKRKKRLAIRKSRGKKPEKRKYK